MTGQLALFAVEIPALGEPREWCPHCRSNWGAGLKQWVRENHRQEHMEVEPGRCALMVACHVTEPFYTPDEKPWQEGCKLTYPRPVGYRGLEQIVRGWERLRSEDTRSHA